MADPNDPRHPPSQELSSEQRLEDLHGDSRRPPPSAAQKPPYDPATPRTDAVAAGTFSQDLPVDPGYQPASSTGPSTQAYDYKPQADPSVAHINPAPLHDETRPSELGTFSPPPGDLPHDAGNEGKGMTTRMHELGYKAAEPINALANKLGSQAFLPTAMNKECDKAAAILMSFCKEGARGEGRRPSTPPTSRSRSRSRARDLLRIPTKIFANAAGLAIFTTARAGFHLSATTGSGILVARLPDGSWGPPSGIQVHALGAGFLAGAGIYDCVCVINTREALDAFAGTRVSLGPEVGIVAGPFGGAAKVDVGASSRSQEQKSEPDPALLSAGDQRPAGGRRRRRSSSSHKVHGPVFTYVKARGFFAGVQVDGTVITERREANHAFYGARLPASQILRSESVHAREAPEVWPLGAKGLYEALRWAESRPSEGEVIVPPGEATPAINDPKPRQGQGGEDPIPRGGAGGAGVVGGRERSETSEKPPAYGGYHGADAPSEDKKAAEAEEEDDPIPRGSPGGSGTASGAGAHKTSDNLAPYGADREAYAPAGDQTEKAQESTPTTGGQEAGQSGQEDEDPIPRADTEGSGTAGGANAHKTSDELPVYGAPRTTGGDQNPPM